MFTKSNTKPKVYILYFSVLKADNHNHPVDMMSVNRGLLLKRVQTRIAQNPTAPVRRVYDREMMQQDSDDDCPNFSCLQTRMKRFRSTFTPSIPHDIDDVNITDEWAKTWKGERFLTYQDNNWGVAVFATKKMIKTLRKTTCIYMDGTFRTAPEPYVQLVTIQGCYRGFIIPLAFCLLIGKTTGHYRQILQYLKRNIRRETGRHWNPPRVVTDFEHSLLIALQTEFPNTHLSGCYFHFNQSLWRHLQQLGLTRSYRHDRMVKKIVRRVMSLGFLPVLLVRQNFY